MSTASNHSPTELKAGKEGRGLSASVMDELRVLKDKKKGQMDHGNEDAQHRPAGLMQNQAIPACQCGGTDTIWGADALAHG